MVICKLYLTQIARLVGIIKKLAKIYHDPVHGPIELHPLLVSILNTHAFDRLKDIKQLGGAYYVYPGATHSRFEHSLGTCYIAGEYIQMLKRKQPELGITEKDVLRIQISALCRNLGYGPFSNLFKNEVLPIIYPEGIPDNLKVPKLSGLILQHLVSTDERVKAEFRRYGIDEYDIEIIRELIDHTVFESSKRPVLHDPKHTFLCEIVANNDTGIDVAKWDYLARDCHYLGIPNEFEWRRLMALSRVIKVDDEFKICYRDKAVNNIYGMFHTRCNLFERVYKHHAVVVIEHMIGDAILKAKMSSNLIEVRSQIESDEVYHVSIHEAINGVNQDSPDKKDLESYLALTDSIVPFILNTSDSDVNEDENDPDQGSLKKAKNILSRLKHRDLLDLIDEVDSTDAKKKLTKKDLGTEYEEDDDVYIITVNISYDSERNVKDYPEQDPIKRVYFYDKKFPWKARKNPWNAHVYSGNEESNGMQPSSKRSNFMILKTFFSKRTRLYASRNKSKDDLKKLKKAFKDAYQRC